MTRPETWVAQSAIDGDTGAIVPPLHLSTTYARDAAYELRHGRTYSRDENPTYLHAEQLIARLEGGAEAIALASGMTAATSVFRALCKPGDHIVASRACYFALRAWLASWSAQWQVAVDIVDTTDLDAVRAALRPTTVLVWIETPANPTWDVTDIGAIAAIVATAGTATVCVDSTAATPVHTRPLALGAHLVMHSATKYLAGHSDVIAGALVTAQRDARWHAIRELRHVEGAVLGPFEAWLLLRGLRTLFVRVERQSRTALRLAERLTERGATVLYPGLPSHPQHAVAARQMQGGFGGMMSILTGGGAERAVEVVKRLRVWVAATSLGGVESLVEHRRTAEGVHSLSPPDLLRLSVGLEHEDDLFDDLAEALAPRS